MFAANKIHLQKNNTLKAESNPKKLIIYHGLMNLKNQCWSGINFP